MLPIVVGMHIRVHNISLRILEGLKLEWTHLLPIFSKDNNDKNPIKQKAACGFILVM
jgi:hypothetical protein